MFEIIKFKSMLKKNKNVFADIINEMTIKTLKDNTIIFVDFKGNEVIAEIDDSKPKADKIEASDSKAKDVSEYEALQKELNASGVKGKVLASTPGDNKAGYLSLVQDGNNSNIVIRDKKNNRTALVSNIRNMGDDVVIFDMMVLNDVKDNDVKSGVWEGSNHIIPVYAQYKIDVANNVTPGMLTTGGGRKPSHYHEYFYEQRNVDTINLFLTKMNILNKIAKEKGAL